MIPPDPADASARRAPRVAVIGSGIAGLTCAHVLSPSYDVTLFEADDRLGGHSNTVTVDDPTAGTLGVDTGFIVHNDRNYPNLQRLFTELDIPVIDTEMSFGMSDRDSGIEYRATNLNTLLADRRNALNPDFWQMLRQIPRFHRSARRFLANGDPNVTFGEFVRTGGFSHALIDLHLVPMGASVWSSSPDDFLDFPALTLFGFLDNHGLLSIGDRPQWKAIIGGSQVYVQRIADRFSGTLRIGTPVHSVRRTPDAVLVDTGGRTGESFDRVVFACHSDQAMHILADASPDEKEIVGAIRYQANRATLHTDTSVMPTSRRAWAAWNYHRSDDRHPRAVLTYDLTLLQRLEGSRRYLVSLNCDDLIRDDTTLASFDYHHPIFDLPAIEAQHRVVEVSGVNRTHYAGAYWGHGFHEDGMASGLRVCRELGVEWPT